jgi:hypothetical protein
VVLGAVNVLFPVRASVAYLFGGQVGISHNSSPMLNMHAGLCRAGAVAIWRWP